jgi:hypothetical protein
MDVANNMQQGWLASVDEVDAGVFRILTKAYYPDNR